MDLCAFVTKKTNFEKNYQLKSLILMVVEIKCENIL